MAAAAVAVGVGSPQAVTARAALAAAAAYFWTHGWPLLLSHPPFPLRSALAVLRAQQAAPATAGLVVSGVIVRSALTSHHTVVATAPAGVTPEAQPVPEVVAALVPLVGQPYPQSRIKALQYSLLRGR